MADWSKSMQQTFEYYVVDPNTWKDMRLLRNVKSCTINRDSGVDTLGSATIDIVDPIDECYVRIYLVTIQNGITEKHPLGTFLVQTPSSSYDGKTRNVSMDAYTPLIELKEDQPPIGYYIEKTIYHTVELQEGQFVETEDEPKTVLGVVEPNTTTTTGKQVFKQIVGGVTSYYCIDESVMDLAYRLLRENLRAPVIHTSSLATLDYDFVSDTSDTWFSFINDLVANSNYDIVLDDLCRVSFAPKSNTSAMQPLWTYNDDNSSILYPDIAMNHDLSMVPNVVEVIYSTNDGVLYVAAKNEDVNSPTSVQNRGREIKNRVTNPNIVGKPDNRTLGELVDYAKRLLKELSAVEYSVSYSHGYCPVRLGDCVRLNYTRAELNGVKAKVISQSIKCDTGCKVTEKAVYTSNNIHRIGLYGPDGNRLEGYESTENDE